MVQILDCTLRDGGYYTNWDFNPDTVSTYLSSVAKLPIDYLEVGYVNDELDGYFGEYFFLTPAKLKEIRATLRPDQKLVVMIDGKNAVPERIEALFGRLSDIIDVVRITSTPSALPHTLAVARELKKLGIAVGFNIMYLSTFQTDLKKIQLAIESADEYDSLALVDSYGGCLPNNILQIFTELRAQLPNMTIGFHGHDNMCLAFANTLAAIEAGADVVDGTFTGMGRGAGNLRTETMLIHKARENTNQELDYQALSNVVAPFEDLRKTYEWGTNLPYMLSGANNLPQRDVMDWLSKSRYSTLSIIRALQQQSGQDVDKTPFADIKTLGIETRKVLLIGGGPSVREHVKAIKTFVAAYDPVVVFSSARHLPLASTIGGRQLLCLPGHDAFRVPTSLLSGFSAAVVSTPPRVAGSAPLDLPLQICQAKPLASGPQNETAFGPVSDNGPTALGLGVADALGAESCWLVGFDGYQTATAAEQELSREVQASFDAYRETRGDRALVSLTPTRYSVAQTSLYGLIAAA